MTRGGPEVQESRRAGRAKHEKLRTALTEQGMKVGKIEATVQEPAPSEAERVRAL